MAAVPSVSARGECAGAGPFGLSARGKLRQLATRRLVRVGEPCSRPGPGSQFTLPVGKQIFGMELP